MAEILVDTLFLWCIRCNYGVIDRKTVYWVLLGSHGLCHSHKLNNNKPLKMVDYVVTHPQYVKVLNLMAVTVSVATRKVAAQKKPARIRGTASWLAKVLKERVKTLLYVLFPARLTTAR